MHAGIYDRACLCQSEGVCTVCVLASPWQVEDDNEGKSVKQFVADQVKSLKALRSLVSSATVRLQTVVSTYQKAHACTGAARSKLNEMKGRSSMS